MEDDYKTLDNRIISKPGEMRTLINEKDWVNTPLGDPKTWPQSLRTMVSVMLDNPFGMYIAWGPDYIQLYNDGYRPILGESKHPSALGNSSRETFAEAWHIIGPMLDDVMKGNATGFPDFLLPLQRNGFVEECYFDFSYSPITNDVGEVGGVLVTVIETTDKKKVDHALKESKQQLEFAIEAAELATWDFNPATQKFTSNDRLKEWFGLEYGVETDLRHAMNSIVEDDRERVIQHIQHALEFGSGGKYDVEYTIVHPVTKQVRIVRAKGKAWYDENNVGYRLNGTIQDITEQANVRKNLEESEEKLLLAIEGAELGTFNFYVKEGKLDWSPKAKELFGLTPDAPVDYEQYMQALHPEDREKSKKMAERKDSLQTGGFFDIELRVIDKTDKRIRWLRLKGKANYDFENNPLRYTGIVQDFTKRKEAEQALIESEEKFRALVDNIPQFTWIADGEGNIIWYNKQWYEYTGTTFEEMEGWGWQSVQDPELLPEVLYKWKNSIKTGQPFEMVIPLKGADGEFKKFLTLVLPLKNSEGKIYQWFGTNTDITHRVEAEEAAKKSEERFRSLANNMAAFVFTGDAEANVTFVNKQWLDFVGLRKQDGIGKTWVSVTHPDDVDNLFKAYLDGVANHTSYEVESRQLNESGEYSWILWKGVPDISKDGVFQGIIGVGIDITDRKNTEEALLKQQEVTDKLQRLYEAVTGNTPDLIYIFDLNYRFTFANRALLSMWGKTWKEGIGNTLLENGYEPWHAEMHQREIDQIVTTKKSIRGTVSFPHAELGIRIHDYIFSPVLDKEGNVEAIAGTTRDITDIRNAEEEAQKSEQQVRAMVENAPFPIGVYIGEEMNVQFVNQAIIDLWNKGADVIGKSLKQILPEFENQNVFTQIESVFQTGIPYHAKNQRLEFDGGENVNVFYFNYSITPLVDSQGNPYGVMSTAADVTDLNLAKLALQKSEENLKNTILQSPVAMCFFKGEDFVVELINDKMLELWGRPTEIILNKPIFEGVTEEKQQGFNAILKMVYSTGKTFSADGMPISLPRNGSQEIVFVNFVFEPFREADGTISGILGVAIDVTEQLTAQKAIQEREQKFRTLSETIPHMIWTADVDGQKNYFNQYFYDFTGLTFEDLKGEGWHQVVHPDDLIRELPLWHHSRETGEDWIIEKRLLQSDGKYRWHLCHSISQKDSQGNLIGWIGTNTDIQDQKIKEQQKDEFIGIASHEMKTPLTTAKGYIELLSYSLNEQDQNFVYVNKALQSVDRLHNLVSELLDASKIQNGQLTYNIGTFDFDKMVTETMENIQITSKKHKIQKVGSSSSQMTGDKDRLQQVLINLLSNAIKYSPNADKVIISVSEYHGIIEVSVQDFGIGISRQHLDKLFERYYRVKEHAVHFQGLGIGLFISNNIILRHRGKMWVESEPGKGSTFSFILPVKSLESAKI